MATTQYATGTAVRLSVQLRTTGRAPVDPATVTVRVTSPSAVTTNYTLAGGQVVKDSDGLYHVDVTPDAAGTWTYAVRTTSPDHTTENRTFTVVPSVFG